MEKRVANGFPLANARAAGGRWLLVPFTLAVSVVFPAAASAPTQAPNPAPADLVLRNGRIVTLDARKPEARALAARGGWIVAVGTEQEVRPYVGEKTQVIDLGGKLVVPGLIEGHGHFLSIGEAEMSLKLGPARSWDEIVAKVAEAVRSARPGDWILGRGWHQEKWDRLPTPSVEGFPTHGSLSRASPVNPVFLTHASGHAAFANAKALELAGVTATTANPSGGEILRDSRGNPTGLLRETAQSLVGRAIVEARARRSPLKVEADARKAVELAARECLRKGLTSFQDAGSSLETIDLFKKLAAEGRLPLRLWVMIRDSNEAIRRRLPQYKILDLGDRHLTVRAIKKAIDGALGSRGAWLLAPYADLPASTGLNTTPVAEIEETARLAIEGGFQLCVHAIGDRANRETLDLYDRVFRAHPDKRDLRWRIEHAQHLHPDDIPRFAKLGVIASMQGIHCTSDAPWVLKRLGEMRAREGAYVWRKLIDSGAVISNGTDAPVEDVDPIACFSASVTRKLKDGTLFYPEQKMTRWEALKSYTWNVAYAAFEEERKGSLEPGKLADATVLSRDILAVPEEQIAGAEVLYTIVGGKVVYKKEGQVR